MTGAITTNSTFDGRSVSADGDKLDAIEANATADQTKDDIDGLGLNYNSLSNKPTIPSNTNQLTNGAGFTTYTANQAVNSNSSPSFTTLNTTTVDLGAWTVTETGGVLFFKHNNSNKMKLDSSGNMTVTGNVTAYGTV